VRSQKVWAVRTKNIAEKVKTGDYVVLYVAGTESFYTIIQIVSEWIPAVHLVWADEMEENKIIYPFQAKVELIQEGVAEIRNLLPRLSFVRNKQNWGVYVRGTPANMKRPIPESDYLFIYETMKSNPFPQDIDTLFKAEVKMPIKQKQFTEKTEKETSISEFPKHNEIRDMIMEIGRLEGKIAEVEYPIDNLRIDAVWKTITSGIPKWAFEVQMGGNFYEALTKLKHAWDKWNSKPVLVTTNPYIAQAKSLLEGSFHEMKEDAKIVNWEKIIKEAHQIKSEIRL
jgi:predicted RNA-binding protein